MTLTLSMLRCPDEVAPETRTVAGGEFSIGRGAENDWVLPDPERGLSKRHCVLAFRAGGWQLADMSTNGTFINHDGEPVGRGQVREVRDGDRLSFGAYEIEVRIAEADPRYAVGGPAAARTAPAPAEIFALDPFAPAPGRVAASGLASGDPLLGPGASDNPFAAGPVSLPPDFDPLAPEPAASDPFARNPFAPDPLAPGPFDREFRGPTQPDHNPHIEDAFTPPQARSVLPDDWDRDLAAARPPPPVVPSAASIPAPAAPVVPAAPPAAVMPEAPREPAPPRGAAAPAPPQPADALLAAFLRGAGLDGVRPADPAAAMEDLGAAFRAVVSGLRQAMIARAAVKGEFRIEQTMIRARGNNPLKFSADDDDALSALLGAGRRSEMGAVEAIGDALRDMRLHELATVAAMQAAVRALLAEFEPAKLRQAGEHGGLSLIAVQRKAHSWDAFEALHARIAQALTDDFDSVFGKAFARAYERALADIAAREPAP